MNGNTSISYKEKNYENVNYNMLDIMRFVAALMVIAIHTAPLEGINSTANFILTNVVARLAVPFFFISTGYLFYKKFTHDNKYIYKYVKKIINIYLGWTVIYTICNIFFSPTGESTNLVGIIKFIRSVLFRGVTFHLWYLVSLIFSILFISYFIKRNKFKQLIVISVALYIIGLLGDSYYGFIDGTAINYIIKIYDVVWEFTKNGLTFAVPLLLIGVLISKYNIDKKFKHAAYWMIPSFIILLAEASVLNSLGVPRDYNMFISLLLVAPIIFISIINFKINLNKKHVQIIRQISLGIYCSHVIFLDIIKRIYSIMGLNDIPVMGIVKFILVAVLSTLFAYLLSRSRNKLIKKYLV